MHGDTVRPRKLALQRVTAHPFPALLSRACDTHDLTRRRHITPHQMTLRIGNENAVILVHAQMFWTAHRGIQRRAAVTCATLFTTGIHHGSDVAGLVHHAESITTTLKDVHISLPVRCHSARIYKRRFGGHITIFWHPLLAITRHHLRPVGCQIEFMHLTQVSDVKLRAFKVQRDAVGPVTTSFFRGCLPAFASLHGARLHIHFTDAPVPGIRDQDVTGGKYGKVVRPIELRTNGRAAITTEPGFELTREMGDLAAAIHLQEPVSGDHLDDPHMPARIELGAERLAQQRLGGRNIHRILGSSRDKEDLIRVDHLNKGEQMEGK